MIKQSIRRQGPPACASHQTLLGIDRSSERTLPSDNETMTAAQAPRWVFLLPRHVLEKSKSAEKQTTAFSQPWD